MYRAYVTRASEQGASSARQARMGQHGERRRPIEAARRRSAPLGYQNFAEVSLAPKMAESPAQVVPFLEDLALRARPHAEQDWLELRAFAANELGMPELQPGTRPTPSENCAAPLRLLRPGSEAILPRGSVVDGLVPPAETLFSVRSGATRRRSGTRTCAFSASRTSDGKLVGQFYLDLYAREGKRGGAWMDDARAAAEPDGAVQTPVAYLTCNFSAPVGGKPALLHARRSHHPVPRVRPWLHHMLTQVDELGVSGIYGVEWDAVELPSHSWRTSAGNGTCSPT